MKIADASATLRFGAARSRTALGSGEDGFGLGTGVVSPKGPSSFEPGSASRGLSQALSQMQLDGSEPSRAEKAKASGEAAEAEFGKWSKMSPAEKIRALILEQHGLDEDSLKALPKEEREAIETEIQEAIEREYGLDKKDGGETTEVTTPSDASSA